jgi:hypothetical protein
MNVINSRNRITHNEYYIQDFKKEKHFLGTAFQIVVSIYDDQFRNANLVTEANNLRLADVSVIYARSSKEITDDFRRTEAIVKRLKSKGKQFARCTNCYYPFAELSPESSSYKCLWCEDSKIKKICSNSYCRQEFWTPSNKPESECDRGFHLKLPTDFKSDYFPFYNEGLRMSELAGISLNLSSASSSGVDPDFLSRDANPKSGETDAKKDGHKKGSD